MKPLVITEGKTDWKHLKTALTKLKEQGLFEQLDLRFLEYEDDVQMGDTELLKMCRAYCKSPREVPTIFVFDRDNSSIVRRITDGAKPYRSWGNKVYSLALPIPDHRQDQPEICVEFYYTDEEITRRDSYGRRLFLSDEFHPLSGLHNSERVHCMDLNKLRRSSVTIVDDRVFDRGSENVALSKSDFADYVLKQIPPFDDLDVSQFAQVFNIIVTILNVKAESSTVKGQLETVPPSPCFSPSIDGSYKGEQAWTLPEWRRIFEPDTGFGQSPIDTSALRTDLKTIESTLESLGVIVHIVTINDGPVFTEYFLECAETERVSGRQTRMKVQEIIDLSEDLGVALGVSYPVQVEFSATGRNAGLAKLIVKNSRRRLVRLRQIMASEEFEAHRWSTVALGRFVSGAPAVYDLAKLKGLLVAGKVGSGKTTFVDSVLACLLLQNSPDQLRFVCADPTGVEYSPYVEAPHFLAPVVTEPRVFLSMMQWLNSEVERRTAEFSRVSARNFRTYRATVRDESEMPFLMLLINELPEFIASTSRSLTKRLIRLVRLLPEVGIYVVLTTRNPHAEVFADLLEHCYITRAAFAMASRDDSFAVLGCKGAEELLGKGDMLLADPTSDSPVRIQASYVSPSEIDRIVNYWKSAA